MTQYAKPAVVPAWGEGVNTAADIIQPSNSEIQTGWPSTQTPPSRQRFNWFFKYVSNGLRYLMQRGLPDWDTLETYDVGAKVTGPDGLSYRSKTANASKVPATNAADWERWGLTADETIAIATAAANNAAAGIVPPNAFTAASQAAMLAQGAKDNDICVRTDLSNQWFVCTALPSSNIANWAALPVQQAIVPATLAEVQAGTVGKLVPAEHAKATYWSKAELDRYSYANNNGDVHGSIATFSGITKYGFSFVNAVPLADRPEAGCLQYFVLTEGLGSNFGLADYFKQIATSRPDSGGLGKSYVRFKYGATETPWQPLGGASLGVNQTRKNVTPNRAAGVPYPNNSGAPIEVSIVIIGTGTFQGSITVGGMAVVPNLVDAVNARNKYTFIVLNGESVLVNTNAGSIESWTEIS